MLDFCAILVGIIAGFVGAPWWTVAMPLALLLLGGLQSVRPHRSRLLVAGGSEIWAQTLGNWIGSACAAAVASFAAGWVIAWASSHFENWLRAVL